MQTKFILNRKRYSITKAKMDKLQRVACGFISLKFSALENLQTGAREQEGIFKIKQIILKFERRNALWL